MSQLLDTRREATPAIGDGGMRDPVAGNPAIGALPPVEAQPGLNQVRSDQGLPKQAIADPTVQFVTQALARTEEHLAHALHHNQRMLANNAHLQALVLERTRDMEEMQHAANHDDLTGLPNRRMLPERLQQALAHAEHNEQLVALVMLDLNGFRYINDRFGHAAGDTVLRTLARRIAMNVSGFDTVCRYGGDEFVMILPDMDRSAALRTVEKILQQVAAPCGLDGHAVSLTASAGIAMYPHDGKDAAQLLEAADTAMYHHKPRFGIGRKPSIRKRWFGTARDGGNAEEAGASFRQAAMGEETRVRATGACADERPEAESQGRTGGKTA